MTTLEFPSGFLWGCATSAHQVEGNNVHSDWWAWEQAGRVKDRSGITCDQWNRYPQDFDLAASLGQNAHRFSIEWSRIEPAEGQWDDEPLAHYVEVVKALRQRHLEPIATLHHFTTPQWLTAQGGWTNPKVVEHFARFTQRVAKALGGQVHYWLTINEPMVFVRMHYVQGIGPPGGKDFKPALTVIRHMIEAHAAAYQILHSAAKANGWTVLVSVAKNMPVFAPCKPWWPADLGVTWLTDRLWNTAFLDALTEGRWMVPGIGTWKLPQARQTLDYLGINFYGRQFFRWQPGTNGWPGESCDLGHHPRAVRERTLMGWDVSPEAFAQTLLRGASLKLPLLITENGAWTQDDAQRQRFIVRHIAAMRRAMDRGARVVGYCYWSLLDNFEWADGYGPRFGITEVDFATQERRVRPSGHRYAEICRTNQLVCSEEELRPWVKSSAPLKQPRLAATPTG